MEERISELKDRNWEMIQMKEEQELSLFFFLVKKLQELSNSIRKAK